MNFYKLPTNSERDDHLLEIFGIWNVIPTDQATGEKVVFKFYFLDKTEQLISNAIKHAFRFMNLGGGNGSLLQGKSNFLCHSIWYQQSTWFCYICLVLMGDWLKSIRRSEPQSGDGLKPVVCTFYQPPQIVQDPNWCREEGTGWRARRERFLNFPLLRHASPCDKHLIYLLFNLTWGSDTFPFWHQLGFCSNCTGEWKCVYGSTARGLSVNYSWKTDMQTCSPVENNVLNPTTKIESRTRCPLKQRIFVF